MKKINKIALTCLVVFMFLLLFTACKNVDVNNNLEATNTEKQIVDKTTFENETLCETDTVSKSETIEGKAHPDNVSNQTSTTKNITETTSNNSNFQNNTMDKVSKNEVRLDTTKTTVQNTTVKTTVKNTTVATTQSKPWGTKTDLNVLDIQQKLNNYASSLNSVVLDNSMKPNDSSWTHHPSTFNKNSTDFFINDMKEWIDLQYDKCIQSGYTDNGATIKMFVYPKEVFNSKVNDTYYEFYILYM